LCGLSLLNVGLSRLDRWTREVQARPAINFQRRSCVGARQSGAHRAQGRRSGQYGHR
jgi:hypothetical protein